MRGPPPPRGVDAGGSFLSHKPALLCVCVCVYWGVRGILLFAFVSLFFFLVWPLASPRLQECGGAAMPAERGPRAFGRSREGSSWMWHGTGLWREFARRGE